MPEYPYVAEPTTLPLDVRSPSEFAQGHIPGAVSLPLLDDTERAVVGTAYKQQSRELAIEAALRYVAPKMDAMVATVRSHLEQHAKSAVDVYCWRGGMRSASITWLLNDAGIAARQMEGGYKAYRRHVLALLELPWKMIVVGGRTGSGKTHVLHALQAIGEQVIDLEALAHHKGSSFGSLMQPPQPSSEHMANLMAEVLVSIDRERVLFVEDESLRIGTVVLHKPWHDAMQHAPIVVMNVDREQRAQHLAADYGDADLLGLEEAFQRIERRIGGVRLQRAMEALRAGDLTAAAVEALEYYDGTYDYAVLQRASDRVHRFDATHLSFAERARIIQSMAPEVISQV